MLRKNAIQQHTFFHKKGYKSEGEKLSCVVQNFEMIKV